MKIGIVGAGNLGTGLTKRLIEKGHAVMLSFKREAAQLKNSADSFSAIAGTPSQAVEFAEVVVLATSWVGRPTPSSGSAGFRQTRSYGTARTL
jgi:predicted dinucleotide-binding enzyme